MFEIRQQIKNENKLIETYFDLQIEKIRKQKEAIINFNSKIAISLQAYTVLAKKEFNDLFNVSFKKIDFDKLDQLETKQKVIDEQVSQIKKNITKNIIVEYIKIGQIENSIQIN